MIVGLFWALASSSKASEHVHYLQVSSIGGVEQRSGSSCRSMRNHEAFVWIVVRCRLFSSDSAFALFMVGSIVHLCVYVLVK